MSERSNRLTYAQAGVDIAVGNELVERIKPAAASTKRPGVADALGGFGAIFDLKAAGYQDPILVAATDGVGTKLRIAIDTDNLDTVGIDLVAMCVNDLICQGAEPLFFLDYFATGKLSVDQAASVIDGVAEGCRRAGCALTGGETAEMPGMYSDGDFDLAGFAVGALERGCGLPRRIVAGDVLLGLASDGVHSNGYSLVRKIVSDAALDWSTPAPFADGSLGDALLVPTRIYVGPLLAAIKAGSVKGLAHITGGGLTENVPRILPDDLSARIELTWPLPAVFRWLLNQSGLEQNEALRTFNCGIGMVVVAASEDVDGLADDLRAAGETVIPLGIVEPASDGGRIAFSGSF